MKKFILAASLLSLGTTSRIQAVIPPYIQFAITCAGASAASDMTFGNHTTPDSESIVNACFSLFGGLTAPIAWAWYSQNPLARSAIAFLYFAAQNGSNTLNALENLSFKKLNTTTAIEQLVRLGLPLLVRP